MLLDGQIVKKGGLVWDKREPAFGLDTIALLIFLPILFAYSARLALVVLLFTALIGAVNVVLITALSTLGAVIYNIASDLVGGVEVTFSEAE